jgi:hypothetical protein
MLAEIWSFWKDSYICTKPRRQYKPGLCEWYWVLHGVRICWKSKSVACDVTLYCCKKAIRDIWSDRVSFTFRVRRLKKNVDCLTLKMNAIRPFETSGNTCPTKLRRTREDLSLLNQFRIHRNPEDGGSMFLRKDSINLHLHVLSGARRM